jgi:putative flippase GtrA
MRSYLRSSWRILVKEITAFGLIGALAFVIDLSLFTWLAPHGALKAKCVSAVVSTTFAYLGNKYLSFSHRARQSVARETAFFFAINLITLVFSEMCLALVVYGLGYGHASTAVWITNIVTIGIGTVFRFWSYKRFVFLHPDRVHQHVQEPELDAELAE